MTLWTIASQASLSMGFSRQDYGGGLPFPSPGDLPDPGFRPKSPALAGGWRTAEPPGKPLEEITLKGSLRRPPPRPDKIWNLTVDFKSF